MTSDHEKPSFTYLEVSLEPDTGIGRISLNRPRKSNALNLKIWGELPIAARWLGTQPSLRVVVLAGNGKNFCAGIDLAGVAANLLQEESCPARTRLKLLGTIKWMQGCFSIFEELAVPVVAAVQGAAFGAAVDLVTCCDLRYCTQDASFCVKEVDVAITADIGTLQRLPGIVGDGVARELCLTARVFGAEEAKRIGLVSDVLPDVESLMKRVETVAAEIASKSPLAVQGTKAVLLHARDHTVADSLDYVATRNSALLVSEDIHEALEASVEKRKPVYSKL